MKDTKIGFVIEETFGEKPKKSEPIVLLPVQKEPITAELKKLLTVNARFDCPCCGKGIQIRIDHEIDKDDKPDVPTPNGPIET